MTISEIEKLLRSLLKGQYSSLTLSFNEESAPNYRSVEEIVTSTDWNENWNDFISSEERTKACQNNTMWTLHWYPNTPVGFCRIHASSLEALLDYLKKK